MPELPSTEPEPVRKKDGRAVSSPINGTLYGGAPKVLLCQTAEETAQLVDSTACAVLAGRNVIRMGARTGPPNKDDMDAVAKLAGIPAEEFLVRVSAKLQIIAEMTTDRIVQKLEADVFKPSELSFLLAVSLDKLARADARAAPSNTVNVQINNFGPAAMRKDILGSLTGEIVQDAIDSRAPIETP